MRDREYETSITEFTLESVRRLCLRVTMSVAKDTDGIAVMGASNAIDLDNTIKLVDSTIDQELIRRYGE